MLDEMKVGQNDIGEPSFTIAMTKEIISSASKLTTGEVFKEYKLLETRIKRIAELHDEIPTKLPKQVKDMLGDMETNLEFALKSVRKLKDNC